MVTRELVRALIKDYSPAGFAAVIKAACAPATFVPVTDRTVKENGLPTVNILGVVKDLPGEANLAAPLLVADIPLGEKPLTERSSRIQQFKVARKALEQVCMHPPVPVAGIIVQGVFAFHDKKGAFRVSLVTATAENGILKWSSAKRQSFYVEQGGVNATFVQRMTMDWSSLAAIKEAFSVERLTKQFYNEIQNWYFWAQLEDQHVSFPNDIDDETDDAKYNGENLIRLITRMVFTWFLKEKKLVNPQLFDPVFLKTALVKFEPEATVDDLSSPTLERNCSYYRAILQNLFFATFNQEIKRRQFLDDSVLDKKRRGVKTYFRNAKLFTEKDPKKILAYFNVSPFVNGGLFECLDDIVQKDKKTGREKVYRWDGFSNNLRERGKLKSAIIPNRLFFCDETTCDLSSVLEGKSAKSVKVRGLIRILESYNFTIEENSPSDEEVALDPELLGKVFENLLGCFNPETQKMARNSTGSFYTPREEVNYMVGESLVAYLVRQLACGPRGARALPTGDSNGRAVAPRPPSIEATVRALVNDGIRPADEALCRTLIAALFRMKLLDPACGSGAFPMGAMLKVVEMLNTLDPDNKLWRKVVIEESKKAIADITDEKEHAAILAEIEQSFDEKMRYPDYARKLYVIEHCIFGSDIQPIAVQISRLRFFISLLCEQRKTDVAADNYGVTPLPNLENNFVAANSLLSIDLSDMRELLKQQKVAKLIRELRETRHRLFLPKTAQQKADLKEKDRKLCDKIDEAAVEAYDEQVTKNLAKYEKALADAKKKRDSMSAKELAEPVFDVVVAPDLFGGESKVMNAKLTWGKKLASEISGYEKEIAAIGNADRKRVLLNNIRTLVKWNPFAFNVAEDFLDPEWMFGVKDGFDIVIANPPYISALDYSKITSEAEKQHLCETYDTAAGAWDLYVLFFERGLGLARADGVLTYITPNKYLSATYGKSLREYIVRRASLVQLVDLSRLNVFESAAVYPVITVLSKTVQGDSVKVFRPDDLNSINSDMHGQIVPSSVMQACPDYIWGAFLSDSIMLLSKVMHGTVRFESVAKINATTTAAEADEYGKLIVEAAGSGKGMVKIINTGTIDPYATQWGVRALVHQKKKFLRPYFPVNDSAVNERRREMYLSPKIIFAKIGIRAEAFYDESGDYASVNTNCVYEPIKDYPLQFLAGLCNSKAFTAVYELYFGSLRMSGGYMQFQAPQIRVMPVPAVNTVMFERVGSKVFQILAAKKANPAADTEQLEQEIDEIVYDLYGLTAEERAIVEKSCEKPAKEAKKPAAVVKKAKEAKKPEIVEEF